MVRSMWLMAAALLLLPGNVAMRLSVPPDSPLEAEDSFSEEPPDSPLEAEDSFSEGNHLKLEGVRFEPISMAEYRRLQRGGLSLEEIHEKHFSDLADQLTVKKMKERHKGASFVQNGLGDGVADVGGAHDTISFTIDVCDDLSETSFQDAFEKSPFFVDCVQSATTKCMQNSGCRDFLAYVRARQAGGGKPGESLHVEDVPLKCALVNRAQGEDPASCSCPSSTVVFCGTTQVAPNTFDANVVMQNSFCNPVDMPYCETSSSVTAQTSESVSYFAASNQTEKPPNLWERWTNPSVKINPSAITAGFCLQVDVDFFQLSGGTFPGRVNLGLKGMIQRSPTSQCLRGTLIAYFGIGFGFKVGNMAFRIFATATGKLTSEEQSLAKAKGKVIWDVPPGYDVSKCHSERPFDVVSKSLKQGFDFLYRNVLTKKYLDHPELKFKEVLAKHREEQQFDFAHYLTLLSSHRSAVDLDAESLQVSVDISWSENTLTLAGRISSAWDALCDSHGGCFGMHFRLWHELDVCLEVQSSLSTHLPGDYEDSASFRAICDGNSRVAEIEVLGPGRLPLVSVPLRLSGCSNSSSTAQGYVIDQTDSRRDVLAVQSLSAFPSGDCAKHDVQSVEVSIQTRRFGKDFAFWTPEMYGTGFPWGVRLLNAMGKFRDADIPDMLRQDISLEKIPFQIDETSIEKVAQLVRDGETKSEIWTTSWSSIMRDLNASLTGPSGAVVGKVDRAVLVDFIVQVMEASRDAFARGASNPVELQALFQAIADVSPTRKCVIEQVESNPPSEAEVAAILACQTDTSTVAADVAMKDTTSQWNIFADKMVTEAQCTMLSSSIPYESLEACMAVCETEENETNTDCNAVLWYIEDQLCNLYQCNVVDGFLTYAGSTLAIFAPPSELGIFESVATDAQIVAGTASDAIRAVVLLLLDSELVAALDYYAAVPDVVALWEQVVAVWEDGMLQFELLDREFVNEFLFDLVHSDFTWLTPDELTALLYGDMIEANGFTAWITAQLSTKGLFKRSTSVEKAVNVEEHMLAGGARWADNYVLQGPKSCKVDVQIEWVYRTGAVAEYIVQPSVVPVVESLFSAYGQFASVLPGYANQVLERLEDRGNDGLFSRFTRILPYRQTDGRHLHRYLRREEEELQIHKGELGLNDAAFNFPKAFKLSRHRNKPDFWFNSGLSVANLFVRAVGDIQAILNLKMAGHTDWDGHCESLPARFNLYHQYHSSFVTERSSTWGRGRVANRDLFVKSSDPKAEMPSFFSGDTVSDMGRRLTEDEKEVFIGWHWISKPHKRRSREQRARFLAATGSATKGKDSWVVENVSDASAVMWPLIWCELVKQHWLEEEQDVLSSKLQEQLQATKDEVDEFLAGDLNRTQYGMVAQVEMIRNELDMIAAGPCPDQGNATLLDGLVDQWMVARQAMEHAWIFSSDTLIAEMLQDLEQAFIDYPERKSEWDEIRVAIESVAATVEGIVHAEDHEAVTFREAEESLRYFFESGADVDGTDQRLLFDQSIEQLQVLRIQREQSIIEATGELGRLAADVPRSMNGNSLDEEKRALRYMDPLITGAVFVKFALERRLEAVRVCHTKSTLPRPLDQERFHPWIPNSHRARAEVIQEILSMVQVATFSNEVQGVDLMFDTACRTSTDDFRQVSVEPRPECEKVTLAKAMLTVFPTLSLRIVKDFASLQNLLGVLTLDPTQGRVEEMLDLVRKFLREFTHGIDEDFYSAFAYQQDGRMFGDLFRASDVAFKAIQGTLQDHENAYTDWIRTSVEYSAQLKRMKRANVKDLADKPEILASAEGCACEEYWSAWVRNGGLPYRRDFYGCGALEDGSQIWGFGKDVSSWPGLCRVKERLTRITPCDHVGKVIACDPSAVPSAASFRVWSSDWRGEPVDLPLVSSKFFLGFGAQTDNPNFCPVDFARLQVLKTYQWSSYSYTPWAHSWQTCTEARIAPPGLRVDVQNCQRTTAGTNDWTVTLNIQWLTTKNTWGLGGKGSGDTFSNWFAGTWLEPMKDAFAQPSWFVTAKDWEASTVWKEFALDQKEIAFSGNAYWLALAAEVLGGFHVPLVAKTIASGYDSTAGVGANSKILAYAWLIWNCLMKWEVIPTSWNIGIGRPAMAKWLNEITPSNVFFSPWRSTNNFWLIGRGNFITSLYKRSWLELFPYMSTEQFFRLGDETSQMGAPTATLLQEFRSSIGNTVDILTNLDRSVLEFLGQEWVDTYDADGQVWPMLVERCAGSLSMYEFDFSRYEGEYDGSSLEMHWFHAKSLSSWLPTPLDPHTGPWYLTEHADGWLVELRPPEEEPRMFPPRYKEIFKVTSVTGPPTDIDLSWLTSSMDVDHLQCLTEQMLPRGGRALLDAHVARGCQLNRLAARSVFGPYFSCFSKEWKSRFFTENWASIVMYAEEMGPAVSESLSFYFSRGQLKGIERDPAGNGEMSEFMLAPDYQASLNFKFKVALNYMHIPGIARATPWLFTSVVYSVANLLESFRVRLLGPPTEDSDERPTSILSRLEERIAACQSCVQDPGMAFCDMEWVVNSMYSNPEDRSYLSEFNSDRCVPRTVEAKNKCKTGKGVSANREAGVLFQQEMCPCFDKASGNSIKPDWYTSEEACTDLKLEDQGESLRVANKISDFENGFVTFGETFNLGSEMVHDPKADGCLEEYTCCSAMISGSEHLRCVNEVDLKNTGWFRGPECKHFQPTDASAQNADRERRWYLIAKKPAWSEADRWMCTSDKTIASATFEGYWSVQGTTWKQDV